MSKENNTSKIQAPQKIGPGPGGPKGMMASGEKVKDLKGTTKKLLAYIGLYKFAILIVIIFAVCSTVFSILGPKILGNATTLLFEGLMGQIDGSITGVDFDGIANILSFLIIIYVISLVFSFMQGFIMSKIANSISYKLRNQINDKILSLPFTYYDTTTNGEVLSKITNDVDSINNGFNNSVTQIITSTVMIVGVLCMMISISWQMTLVALITLPTSGLVIGLITKKSQKFFKSQQKGLATVNGIVEETYSSHNIVKVFNAEEEITENFVDESNKLYFSAWKANFLSSLMMPIVNIIGNFGYVVICILGGIFAANGSITVGNIQSFIQYMKSFTQPIAQVSQISNVIQQTLAAAERVFEFLEEENESETVQNPLSVKFTDEDTKENAINVTGNVSFNNVKFGYVKDNIIVNNFSSTVKPGQKIAIVGPTGAGKSTIIKLLMRFYDVNSGDICLEGYNINDFDRGELRSAFGMVLQDTWLFGGSILENLRYGKLDATDEEVKEAAIIAQADHFIRTLPNGYNMELNEEASNVSQGQKQLLTIARAILADPKILILDEATSSVDTRTELLIQKAMDRLMQGRTSFIIAHRLSTIKNADIILVMNNGDIVEQGSHDELLEKGEFYAKLYNSQFAKSGTTN